MGQDEADDRRRDDGSDGLFEVEYDEMDDGEPDYGDADYVPDSEEVSHQVSHRPTTRSLTSLCDQGLIVQSQ